MISLYDIKPRFQALLRPAVTRLVDLGISANMVTLAAVALCIATGVLVWFNPENRFVLFLVAPVLLIRMALNAIDGMIARKHDQVSKAGFFLNELGDVIGDATLYLSLAAPLSLSGLAPGYVVLFVVFALITEFAGAIAPAIGAARRYDGPMGKSDRALVIGALCIWTAFGLPGSSAYPSVFAALITLCGLTTVLRIRRALAEAGTGG